MTAVYDDDGDADAVSTWGVRHMGTVMGHSVAVERAGG
jgi:hypothetical protein